MYSVNVIINLPDGNDMSINYIGIISIDNLMTGIWDAFPNATSFILTILKP
jgi:hypothetical protein